MGRGCQFGVGRILQRLYERVLKKSMLDSMMKIFIVVYAFYEEIYT